MVRIASAALAAFAAVTLVACGGDSTGPADSAIAGTYTATTLQVTEGGFSADALSLGVRLTLTLTAPSTVAGTMTIPAAVSESGRAEVENLAGTFTRTGDIIRFNQTADTFVRDLPFTVSGNTLSATNATSGTAVYTVVLTRQ